jgi:hypothetical protein
MRRMWSWQSKDGGYFPAAGEAAVELVGDVQQKGEVAGRGSGRDRGEHHGVLAVGGHVELSSHDWAAHRGLL